MGRATAHLPEETTMPTAPHTPLAPRRSGRDTAPSRRAHPTRRPSSRLAVSAVGLAAVLSVAALGCSSDSDDEAGEPPAATTPATGAPSAPSGTSGTSATSGTADVTVQDFVFTPGTVTVAQGAAVTFTNRDGFTHTATAGAPGSPSGAFDLRLAAGTDGEVSPSAPGTYPYFCAIHEQMRGELVITG